MEVHEAFTKSANFREVNGKANLSITKITQAAFIEVNENENNEAAPLTGIKKKKPQLNLQKKFN